MKRSTNIRSVILVAVLSVFATAVWGQDPTPSTPSEGDAGSAAAPPARAFRPSDLWAPPSSWHAGPLMIYSAEISGGFSTAPITPTGQFADLGGFVNQGGMNFLHASTYLGLSHRWRWGVLDFSYTPTFSRDSMLNATEISHDISIRFSRALGRWDLTLIATGGTYDEYNTLFQQQPIAPVLQMQTPLANSDMLSLISLPPVLTLPKTEMLLVGQTVARGNAGAALSRQLSARTRLTFSGFYNLSRPTASENNGVQLLAPNERMSSRSFSMSIDRAMSARYHLGFSVSDQATSSLLAGVVTQRAAQLTFGWLPTPKWSLVAAGGPALQDSTFQNQRGFSSTWNVQLARSLTSSSVSVSYGQDLDLIAAIPGAIQNRRVSLTWMRKARTSHWMYSFNGGYQWVQGGAQLGTVVQGWILQPTLSFPINRSLEFFTQYVFFGQEGQPLVSGLLSSSALRRQMVVWGLRWRANRTPSVMTSAN